MILIIGAGCIGSFLAQYLKANQIPYVIKIKQNSISKDRLLNSDLKYVVKYHEITIKIKLIIVTVKSYDLKKVSLELNQNFKNIKIIYSYNGLFFENNDFDQLSNRLIVTNGYKFKDNEVIELGLKKPWIYHSSNSNLFDKLKLNEKNQFKVESNLVMPIVKKCLINYTASFMCITKDMPVGSLFINYHKELENIFFESFEILSHCYPMIIKFKSDIYNYVFYALKNIYNQHYSSAYVDIKNGKNIEFDTLNLALIKYSKKNNLKTPVYNNNLLEDIYSKYPKYIKHDTK